MIRRTLCYTILWGMICAQNTVAAKNYILTNTDSTWDNELHALFLANLLGHFKQDYTIQPVTSFNPNLIEKNSTIFYLGDVYNTPLPEIFLKYIRHTTNTIVWLKYNLWQLQNTQQDFTSYYGFTFNGLDQTHYDNIKYKNIKLQTKSFYPELGVTEINDPNKVQVFAYAEKNITKIPYIIHSKNLWYIADIPFENIQEKGAYLAFADILYDILNISTPPQRRALVRLEDIHPMTDPSLLKKFADFLNDHHIPFTFSIIPYYRDPLQVYPNLPNEKSLLNQPELIAAIHYLISKGGTLILHGYTHQYGDIANPYLGITGADYEFMRVEYQLIEQKLFKIEPLYEDSESWVSHRIEQAEKMLYQAGFFDINYWETPHYLASSLDNQYFAQHFKANIGRIEYFSSKDPNVHESQFFPYVIYQDVYGQKVIPENLGCYSPHTWFNYPSNQISDLLLIAEKNLVLRDAWASFYYHPFLGLEDFKKLIEGIENLGYQFVSIETL